MTTGPLFDRTRLREAFDLLAAKLARRGVVGEIHVFGGAAMVLAFDARAATRDVGALFVPDGPMLEAAAEVAVELGLPRSWLNNQASTYVSGRAGRGTPVYDHASLRVMTTPPEHLLAMKVRAARAARDVEDIRLLLAALEVTTVEAALEIVNRFFPDDPLGARSANRSRISLRRTRSGQVARGDVVIKGHSRSHSSDQTWFDDLMPHPSLP